MVLYSTKSIVFNFFTATYCGYSLRAFEDKKKICFHREIPVSKILIRIRTLPKAI